ncbi:MAG: hypothetical protein AAF743_04940 [Planctomycetota bacterium]
MRHLAPTLIGLVLLLVVAGCATPVTHFSPDLRPAEMDRVAVVVLNKTGQPVEPGMLRVLEDEFTGSLTGKGYQTVARSDYGVLANEAETQNDGVTESAQKFGKLLNSDKVLLVYLTELVQIYYEGNVIVNGKPRIETQVKVDASARLVEAEDGRVVWSSTLRDVRGSFGTSHPSKRGVIKRVAMALSKEFPDRFTKQQLQRMREAYGL